MSGSKRAAMAMERRNKKHMQATLKICKGLTQEQITKFLLIEADVLHVREDRSKNLQPNEHTPASIANRLQEIGITCNDELRIYFAHSCERIGHHGIAPTWFESVDNPRECHAFRSYCVRTGQKDLAERYFKTLTRAEYGAMGRAILESGAGFRDTLRAADEAFCLARDTKGLEVVLKRAVRHRDLEYIRLRGYRPLREQEKIALIRSYLKLTGFHLDAETVFTFIRDEKLSSAVAHQCIVHLFKDRNTSLKAVEAYAAAVQCTLTVKEVEAYLNSRLRELRKDHAVRVEEIEAAIDWLVVHGAKRWIKRERGILLEIRSFLMKCNNIQLLDTIATKSGQPLSMEELLAYVAERQKQAHYGMHERKQCEEVSALIASRIVEATGVPAQSEQPPQTSKQQAKKPKRRCAKVAAS